MSKLNLAEVINFINETELTTHEWEQLTKAFVAKRKQRIAFVREDVYVGQLVEFFHKTDNVSIKGQIASKGVKNATVQTLDGSRLFRVPFTLLKAVAK
jgi:hypothetical protein